MDKNILTPLGKIVVYVNDTPSTYDFSSNDCKAKAVLESPISACYIISVPSANAKNVRCVIELNCENILTNWDSDERYLGIDFIKDSTIVTIGAEADNPEFDAKLIEGGIQYFLKSPSEVLHFSVAWATDYKDQFDIRTNLATDIFCSL